jgi:hypothetical protein
MMIALPCYIKNIIIIKMIMKKGEKMKKKIERKHIEKKRKKEEP